MRTLQSHSGFTLVQILIGLVVFSVLAGGLVLSYQGTRRVHQLEATIQKLSDSHRQIRDLLMDDLNSAVLVTGKTQNQPPGGVASGALPGIGLLPPGSGMTSAMLQIFQESFPGMNMNVNSFEFDTVGQSGSGFPVKLIVKTAQQDPYAKNFFLQAISKYRYFFLASGEKADGIVTNYQTDAKASRSFIITRSTSNSDASTFSISTLTFLPFQLEPSQLGSGYFITAARRVRYFVNNSKQLVREVYYQTDNKTTEILYPNVDAIEFKLWFSDQFTPTTPLVNPPDGFPVSTIHYTGCEEGAAPPSGSRCPDWSDLSMIRINIKLQSDSKVSVASAESILPSGFSVDSNGSLFSEAGFTVAPAKFLKGTSEATGVPVDCLPLTANRCKPACAQYFTASWSGLGIPPENWVGYGQYVESAASANSASSYCRCGVPDLSANGENGVPAFHRPEENWAAVRAGVPMVNGFVQWHAIPDERKDQFTACGEHFGCTWDIFPIAAPFYMGCQTLQPVSLFVNPNYPHTLKAPIVSSSCGATWRARWQNFENQIKLLFQGGSFSNDLLFDSSDPTNPATNSAWYFLPSVNVTTQLYDPPLADVETYDCGGAPLPGGQTNLARYLSCGGGPLYGKSTLELLTGKTCDNSTLGNMSCPWNRKCGCFNYGEDVNGVTGNVITSVYADLRLLCNWNPATNSLANPLYCPNTYDAGANAYRLKSPTQNQGLPPERAALCACLTKDAAHPITYARPYDPSSGNNWPNKAYNRTWDFRVNRSSLGGVDWSAFEAGLSAKGIDPTAPGNLTIGSFETRSTPAYSVTMGGSASAGAVYSCDDAAAALDWEGLFGCTFDEGYANASVLSSYAPLANYCKTSLATGNPKCSYLDAELVPVRQIITGQNDLPTTCGGTLPASGSPGF